MNVLVLNSGSSSIKFSLFKMPEEQEISLGLIEKIGEENALVTLRVSSNETKHTQLVSDHSAGLKIIADFLADKVLINQELSAIGHRVVHGGEAYSDTQLITDEVLRKIDELAVLAPLHNPPNAEGIRVSQQIFPQANQVAIFDTAFHSTIPPYTYRYPVPNRLYQEHGIRVYGMHGTSHQYVTQQAASFLGKPLDSVNLITIHLGNGCSMTAVKNGKSTDTSMGLSPLAGLMMGTRSGDIDPAIPFFLSEQAEMSPAEIDHLLNHESGLKGITGENDLREVLRKQEQEDKPAKLALEMYCYRIKKYVGAYLAVLGSADALVFTAGVGENSPFVREKSLEGLEALGIQLDSSKNNQSVSGIQELQAEDSKIKILVVPTNEELAIAQQTFQLLSEEK
ncbi:acetate/propionate family kinase [Tunicatimonas pelagia]|uniref:acetate/propionate family kinase n=1 Tax=Tunicatimonas pelagia TaxID=931531 RepID=UPI0026661CC0|nr:acetate kinase [Tunicatimonas pelagia]WKN43327.1 acetate kinase [Tunicatimonas pelagia]